MPDVETELDFMVDMEVHETQRPFVFTPGQEYEEKVGTSEDALNTVNLVFERVTMRDIRDTVNDYSLAEAGFEMVENETRNKDLQFMEEGARDEYARETEEFWKNHLGVEYALCYNVKLRSNGFWDPNELVDLGNRGWHEPPARGIHDVSFEQAPVVIAKRLIAEGLSEKYLKPGYRFRIVNTWRPLIPVIEDKPLAFCDSRSIDPNDLILADRIMPNDYYTLYFLRHNEKQRWHWISRQTPGEIILLLNYDTKPGGARFCAHGSFVNPLAPPDAPIRQSIETRTLVISKE